MMRLDKFLKYVGYGSRSLVKKIIKQKRVLVNGCLITEEGYNVDENQDVIQVDGKILTYIKYIYLMLNKPQGYVSARIDNLYPTVLDLINEYQYLELFPVGRLDLDTEGLLLITNDGNLAHQLLQPKFHVNKTYYLTTDMPLTDQDILILEKGIILDGKITKPAKIIKEHNGYCLTINEGRFHQVKRMINSVNKNVTYLKRISFGPLKLDEKLALGEYRLLTNAEIELLKNKE